MKPQNAAPCFPSSILAMTFLNYDQPVQETQPETNPTNIQVPMEEQSTISVNEVELSFPVVEQEVEEIRKADSTNEPIIEPETTQSNPESLKQLELDLKSFQKRVASSRQLMMETLQTLMNDSNVDDVQAEFAKQAQSMFAKLLKESEQIRNTKTYQEIKVKKERTEEAKQLKEELKKQIQASMQPKRQLARKDTPQGEDQKQEQPIEDKENSSARRKKYERHQSGQLSFEQRKALLKESIALKDASNKPILKHQKNYQKQPEQIKPTYKDLDIKKIIHLDSQVINYGKFYSGKMLGSTLVLTNKSKDEQIIELCLDNEFDIYESKQIFGPYKNDELPFIPTTPQISNSEKEHGCWYIENPVCKELCKSLTLKIGGQSEQEFIIVIKAPHKVTELDMTSFVKVKLLTHCYDEEKGKRFTPDMRDLSLSEQKQRFERSCMLVGKISNPNLKCMRAMFSPSLQEFSVPLVVKKAAGNQKFRLPFKDLSNCQETDIDFSFIKLNGEDADIINCIEFFCMPAAVKIQNKTQSVLNIVVKVNPQKLEELEDRVVKRRANKLLIGRVKDTSLMFSFYLSIKLVE